MSEMDAAQVTRELEPGISSSIGIRTVPIMDASEFATHLRYRSIGKLPDNTKQVATGEEVSF